MIKGFSIDSQTVFERRFFKSGHGREGDQKRPDFSARHLEKYEP